LIAPALNRIGRRLNAMAVKLLEPRAGEMLLDIGIGGGGLLRRLATFKPGQLAGVDISAAVVTRARRRFGKQARIVQASADALPFADRIVDGATSVSVLHFWPDLLPPLREIARVLKPGGRLVLVFEPPTALRRWPGHVHGFQLWEPDAVVAAASKVGLHLEERREGAGHKPDFFVGLRLRKGV
jgi:ubiquinone/menaquinone biosynthesis C-methylase UbiE